ncbi:MAG: hypothetical protein ACI8WB_001410 [Phenylobacterium sp.]|jgi:hypothetical protein
MNLISDCSACLDFASEQGIFARKIGAYNPMQLFEYENNAVMVDKMSALNSYFDYSLITADKQPLAVIDEKNLLGDSSYLGWHVKILGLYVAFIRKRQYRISNSNS